MLVVDGDDYLVQMPFVARLGTAPANLIGILLPKLFAPLPNTFVGDEDSPVGHHLLYVPIAQAEGEIQPDAITDDLGGEAVTMVQVGVFAHGRIIPETAASCQPQLT